MTGVSTTCPYCGVGCGVIATPDGQGGASIAGDPAHPANFGKLCSKGSALGETLGLETRLLYPEINGARASWDEALDRIASGFSRIIAQHGPDAVAFYLSGQLLTEDYYVANKLMKGFIGSGNVDTNSRLCMSSSVAGHKRAFGSDSVPCCYEDLDVADLFVIVGSNAAWCHPILFRRILAAKTRGARIIVVDPRRTATAEESDLHLPIKPGADATLFSGLLAYLASNDALAPEFIKEHTSGFAGTLQNAQALAPDVDAVARDCGLAPVDVAVFFAAFASTERVVTIYSQGVNQSAQGTDKVNAIINCHLATGRIGRIGMGPFSFTGQPNAMGGREVGGMANQLAAHMDFTPEALDRVRRFWNAPGLAANAGLKAVDLFDAVEDGRIKALWVMGTNPAVSIPRAAAISASLAKLDLFVVSENVASNDTLQAGAKMHNGAHIRLPTAAWGEKDGTVTNSERRISRQRAFLALPGEARPDWRSLCDVAVRMGFGEAFAFTTPAAIFREHAALSAFENSGARDFDLGSLARLDDSAYAGLSPVQWPVDGAGYGRARLFDDRRFFTPDHKARFVAVAPTAVADVCDAAFPILLNTGRLRDQWHTMTRTGLSARLGGHAVEPVLSVHPADAVLYGLENGAFAIVSSAYGLMKLRVCFDETLRRGEAFAPIHWSNETATSARASALIAGVTDPFSGQPETKATPVRLSPLSFASAGFVLARRRFSFSPETLWAWQAVNQGFAAKLASDDPERIIMAVSAQFPNAEILTYRDPASGVFRAGWIVGDRLTAIVFLGPTAHAPHWRTVQEIWERPVINRQGRRMVLSGAANQGGSCDDSPLVCSCFGVSQAKILAEAKAGADDAAAIGLRLKAGTNCGSCLPEIRALLSNGQNADRKAVLTAAE